MIFENKFTPSAIRVKVRSEVYPNLSKPLLQRGLFRETRRDQLKLQTLPIKFE